MKYHFDSFFDKFQVNMSLKYFCNVYYFIIFALEHWLLMMTTF